MNKRLDENIFLKIIKEEWEKEVKNLIEKDEKHAAKKVKGVVNQADDKKADDKKKKKKPVKLSPDLIDDNLAVGLTIKNDDGFEFKIMKVTDDYVLCDNNLTIPRSEESLNKYTLA